MQLHDGSYSWLALAAFLALTGCTGSSFKASAGAAKFPAFKGQVRELPGYPRDGRYDRVGVVIVNGPEAVSDERLKIRLKADAADQGANAVIYQGAIKRVPYEDGHWQKRLAAFALRQHQ